MLPNLKSVLVLRYWIYECYFVCNFVLIQIIRELNFNQIVFKEQIKLGLGINGLARIEATVLQISARRRVRVVPESIAQFYFVDTKIGIAMIIQYTKKYKLDKQDVEWAKLAAPKVNNAKNMNDIIQIVNE
ncbi:Hypothetical_protein [Hexamita inflata]|uniref:Hypothetical_protein n=1 Tax=Hexamita inflata TaxID=28002 RepID=A0AA86N8V2_9EUKA|nr:Hypothetical protein HINF_LOCUS2590 [Hexamita inflata]